jgi:hypothetical protein
MSLLEGYFTDTKALLQRHLGDLLATLPRPYGDLNAIFLLLSYYFPIIFLSFSSLCPGRWPRWRGLSSVRVLTQHQQDGLFIFQGINGLLWTACELTVSMAMPMAINPPAK